MSMHTATVRWRNQGPDFLRRRYSREHTLHFDGGAAVSGSPSPQIVAAPWSNPAGVDPEEMFIASVSSCHMLWFLHVACDAGFLPESYEDAAEGIMTKNERSVLWISQIILRPLITWGGEKQPAAAEVAHLHHLAHQECFIANSMRTDVTLQTKDMKPQRFAGQFITLTPLDVAADVPELFAISHADETTRKLWRYMPRGPFASVEEHAAFLREWQATPGVVAFVVRSAATQGILGSISLMNIRPEHGVAELGNVWYVPAAQRTKANTEACYLLLRHCFEDLGYRRMEWKCDARNDPSRNAALRLGFTFEGIFRQHMIVKGENRDTAWFAMLDHEWPQIGKAMRCWLYEDRSISLGRLMTES